MGAFYCTANKGVASVKSVLLLTAAASVPRRGVVVEWSIGSDSTPADNAYVIIVQRCSTAGTGTTVTPNAADPADPIASTIVATGTVTADPTLTASAFLGGKALNQRASWRWVAVPGFEIIIPATASNGIMLGASSATTTSFQADAAFRD